MALLNIAPQEIDVIISRGDTTPWTFTIQSLDITGFSYLITVDPETNPVDATNNLFQLTGTITDGPNGIVAFELSASQADQLPEIYHYDLQQTDGASKIRSIVKGKFTFKQDITK